MSILIYNVLMFHTRQMEQRESPISDASLYSIFILLKQFFSLSIKSKIAERRWNPYKSCRSLIIQNVAFHRVKVV